MALTKWWEGGQAKQKAQEERTGCTGLAVAHDGGVSNGVDWKPFKHRQGLFLAADCMQWYLEGGTWGARS
jgi:hypothetical protein